MLRSAVVCFLAVGGVLLTYGQEPVLRHEFTAGIWGAAGANFHAPDLRAPGTYNRNATGLGWGAGAGIAVPIASSLGLGLRVGYEALGAELRSTTDSTLSASLGAVELFPHVLFWIGRRLYVPLGVELGISTAAQYQLQGQTAWQEVPQKALRVALGAGVGWAVPVSRSVTLAPEVAVRVPLSDVSSDQLWSPWKVTQLRAGLGLWFGFASEKKAEPEPESAPPVVSLVPSASRLRLEEVRWTEYFPLLPYVFFPEGSATPDRREHVFQEGKAEFALERLPMDALGINRSILDIVGKRMNEYPAARLTVTGTTDGKRETLELARQRAEWVKQYLVTTWGIAPERIVVQARRYPEKPSASRSTVPEDRRDGDAENRRVELTATIPDVVAPLPLTAENQRYAQPEVLSWEVTLQSQTPISAWELLLSQAGDTVEVLRGEGAPASPILWRVPAAKLRAGELPLEYLFRIRDTRGRTVQTVGSLPVEYLSTLRKRTEQLPDKTITRFSLVLFDFDSDVLTPENQRILEQLVLPFVRAQSSVRIVGYTDRIGESDYNRQLSLRRAQRVRDFLAARVPAARYDVAGYGEAVLLFDNNSPIGRQLCRTVQITIETPNTAP